MGRSASLAPPVIASQTALTIEEFELGCPLQKIEVPAIVRRAAGSELCQSPTAVISVGTIGLGSETKPLASRVGQSRDNADAMVFVKADRRSLSDAMRSRISLFSHLNCSRNSRSEEMR